MPSGTLAAVLQAVIVATIRPLAMATLVSGSDMRDEEEEEEEEEEGDGVSPGAAAVRVTSVDRITKLVEANPAALACMQTIISRGG